MSKNKSKIIKSITLSSSDVETRDRRWQGVIIHATNDMDYLGEEWQTPDNGVVVVIGVDRNPDKSFSLTADEAHRLGGFLQEAAWEANQA